MKLTIYQGDVPTILDFQAPALLSALLALSGLPFSMPCGGRRRCRKCLVRAEGELSPHAPEELRFLSREEREQGLRYACMTTVLGDAAVWLPEKAEQRILTAGQLPAFPLSPWASGYGAAFDIGTTTVAAYLCRLDTGIILAADSMPNPQGTYGADVISRISCALDGGGTALADTIHGCLGALLSRLCRQAQIAPARVEAIVLTGNTAMEYLLTGSDPSSIARAPFAQDRWFGEYGSAEALGFSGTSAKVYITRCISAYVGGDITSAILAADLLHASAPVLLADIGTNGEIALATGGRLYCCSTAAGPALEGAGIYMGMTASDGAISHVRTEDGILRYDVIGNTVPQGICGSGIVDAAAALLSLGYVDETGAIDDLALPDELYTEVDGMAAIRFPDSRVVITQKDIRSVQLAKSAIRAGMETLLQTASLQPDDVETLYIAGGFGNVLDIDSACAIGLFPAQFADRAVTLGNAAGMGAIMQLLSGDQLRAAEDLSRMAETVELSTSPIFQAAYIENMPFPDA